jgi:hypothetical protein
MDDDAPSSEPPDESARKNRAIRAGFNIASGMIPFLGGALSAAASAWSEREQEKVNDFLRQWLKMLEDELREKAQTVLEIMSRLDLQDDKIADRVASREFQGLVRKAFRDWAAVESEEKRKLVRNILTNAASTAVVSDDVIRMFLDWLKQYSETHFSVIGAVYNRTGITRGGIWAQIGRQRVAENSADADLFRLLIRDLSTGGIIRQHRETDYAGNFMAKPAAKRVSGLGPKPIDISARRATRSNHRPSRLRKEQRFDGNAQYSNWAAQKLLKSEAVTIRALSSFSLHASP